MPSFGSTEKSSSRKTILSSNENLSDNSCQGTRKTRSRTTKPNSNESLHGLVEAFVASSLISPPTVMNFGGTTTTSTTTTTINPTVGSNKNGKTNKKSLSTSLRTIDRTDNELLDASTISDPAMRTGGTHVSINTSIHTATTATLSSAYHITDRDEDEEGINNLSSFSTTSEPGSTLLKATSSTSSGSNKPHNNRRNTSSVNVLGAATAKAIALAGENTSIIETTKNNYRPKANDNQPIKASVTANIGTTLPVLQTINHNVQPVVKKEESSTSTTASTGSTTTSSTVPTATTTTTINTNTNPNDIDMNTQASTKELSTTQSTTVQNTATTATTLTTSGTNTSSTVTTDTGSNEYWGDYDNSIILLNKEREADEELTPRHGYMSYQTDVNDRMRAILIDWLIDVHYKYRLHAETLFLAINIVDRFLSRRCVPRARLQLVGVTAMWIACKRQEIWVPELRDFVYITDSAYTTDDILFCETEVLRVLKFRLEVPTVYIFATHLLRHLQIEETNNVWYLTMYLLERSLQEYHFLRYFPSRIAAAAVTLALYNLKGEDHPTEEKYIQSISNYTDYSFNDLSDIIMDFQYVMNVVRKDATSHSVPLVAVDRKFALPKYGNVAELTIQGPAKLP